MSPAPNLPTGTVLILLGVALAVLGPTFDGFVKGACQGAGITLALLGVLAVGARLRGPRGEDDSMWLPSRDDR